MEEKKIWNDLTKEEIRLWDKAALTALRYWIGDFNSKEKLARSAYDYADAMLTERKRRIERSSSK